MELSRHRGPAGTPAAELSISLLTSSYVTSTGRRDSDGPGLARLDELLGADLVDLGRHPGRESVHDTLTIRRKGGRRARIALAPATVELAEARPRPPRASAPPPSAARDQRAEPGRQHRRRWGPPQPGRLREPPTSRGYRGLTPQPHPSAEPGEGQSSPPPPWPPCSHTPARRPASPTPRPADTPPAPTPARKPADIRPRTTPRPPGSRAPRPPARPRPTPPRSSRPAGTPPPPGTAIPLSRSTSRRRTPRRLTSHRP